jgi:hypothetical protein
MDWLWQFYTFILYFITYLTFVSYLPEDAHMFGRNM